MKRRSLILITVDCLRADHVGLQGYARPVTPFLDSLSRNSAVVSNAIVAGAPTYFSFPAIMASRYSLTLGREAIGIAPGEPTIATVLKGSGYATAAFLAGNPYLSARYGYDQGFDEFQDFLASAVSGVKTFPPQTGSRMSGLNRRFEAISRHTKLTSLLYDELYFRYCQRKSAAENLTLDQLRRYPAADLLIDKASSWLTGVQEQPFFLWIHLMDPHHPYYPPKEALESLGITSVSARRARYLNSYWNRGDIGPNRLRQHKEEVVALYDAGIHWVDKQLARLASILQELQRWDETVFVVTADHGEEFLEREERYHSPTGLPEPLIHVPLLIRAPGSSSAKISSSPFSMIHLAPTLLEAVGTQDPVSFQGRSCWKEISVGQLPAAPVITECADGSNGTQQVEDRTKPRLLAVRDGDLKLVIRFSNQSDSLYDLKNDPEERSPLPVDACKRDRVRLLQIAREHLRRSTSRRDPALAVRARVREIRRALDLGPLTATAQEDHAVETARHG
jgi:arylsulfatase A-like enzyme